jgi:nucleoside-diphosphate-sugar epimerase
MPVGEFKGQDLITPAREGTRRVLQAAFRAGDRRVITTSSVQAALPPPGPSDGPATDEKRRAFSSVKAETRLGWRHRPAADSIVGCAKNLVAEGLA